MPASNRLANSTALGRQAGRLTGVDTSTREAIIITDSRAKLIIRRVKVHHVSGSANHFHAAIYRAVGALPNSIEQELYGDQTNSLDLFDVAVEIPCQTDDDGKLWLAPGPNSGTNNVFDYEIFWELAR
jgi:hypothetical protein